MLTPEGIKALLRAAVYFRSRPYARIGRNAEAERVHHKQRMRRLREKRRSSNTRRGEAAVETR